MKNTNVGFHFYRAFHFYEMEVAIQKLSIKNADVACPVQNGSGFLNKLYLVVTQPITIGNRESEIDGVSSLRFGMTGRAGEAGDSSQAQNDKVVAQEHSGARRSAMSNNHDSGGARRFILCACVPLSFRP